ncbi:MAG: hypothetical protein HN353_01165 [Bdellovibrionales bacterium]|jgi:type II secretion system protein C|nr:hypothetical protein [Bdellovibrionales bacterium]MBT3526720.1 hypothetical protein [Bdellovibrionales bacterium]MBT7669923.1 hypothetical protein [Bdellovibrionales bacterium]MBT7767687.1 hypothetical protein [Bdellovibrionales bacterium]
MSWLDKLVKRITGKQDDQEHDPKLADAKHDLKGPELNMDRPADIGDPEELAQESSVPPAERDPHDVTRRIDLDQLMGSSDPESEPTPPLPEETKEMTSLRDHAKRFNIDNIEIVSKVFSPSYRGIFHKSFILAMLTLSTLFGGKLVALWLQPIAKSGSTTVATLARTSSNASGKRNATAIKSIADTNIFRAKRSADVDSDKKPIAQKQKQRLKQRACLTASKKSTLPIKFGTSVVLQDTVKSVVSVQVRGNSKLLRLREGDKIKQMAKIGRITGDRLILKNINSGKCEYVERKKKSSPRRKLKIISAEQGKKIADSYHQEGIENVGNRFKIKKKLRDNMLKDIGKILTQARAIQIKNPDGTLSFKMVEIEPGSIYNQLNITDGDIITAINGKKIDSLNEIMNMFGKISDIENMQITLKRNGGQEVLDYTFE